MFPTTFVLEVAKAPLHQQFAILEQLGIRQLSTELAGVLNASACFFLWANGLLTRLPYLTEDARCKLMARLLADEHIGRDIVCNPASLYDNASYRLAISDRRYVTTEFSPDSYLDVKTGETLSALPSPTFEAIIYDLAELFRQNAKHCQKAAADGHDADEKVEGRLD